MPAIAVPFALVEAQYANMLSITVSSDKSAYYPSEPINIFGNFTQNGQPVSNGTVAIAVYDSSGAPIAFRTVKTGLASPPRSLVDFLELTPCNQTGGAQSSFLLQQTLYPRVAIQNLDNVAHNVVTTVTALDANGVVLGALFEPSNTLGPGSSMSFFFQQGLLIPSWAQPGNATLCANVFSNFPKNGGTAYCQEERVNFEIKRNPQIDYSTPPTTSSQTPNGTFASSLKLSSDSVPGNYQVDVSAQSTLTNGTVQSLQTTQSATSFSVIDTPTPPQAAFTYYPVVSYVNMTITFDASASTAEDYNVTIANYQWNFGDGSPNVNTTNPLITHAFTLANNYSVSLNVTDSQGLWCTTSKVITILPPSGPTANFNWIPSVPAVNQTVTFDGSSPSWTQLGWNGTGFSPIVSYAWNFGDGNITSGYYPTILHTYAAQGNYTVTLSITDADALNSTATHTVAVGQTKLIGDINGDGVVDIFDAVLLAKAFNSHGPNHDYAGEPASPNWNPNADLNGDGVVDIFDAVIFAAHFGNHL
jgi:PKD repeat protein